MFEELLTERDVTTKEGLEEFNKSTEDFLKRAKNRAIREEVADYFCNLVMKEFDCGDLSKAWALYKEKYGNEK